MALIRKIKAGRIVTLDLDEFVGEYGTIFYDEDIGELRISDGVKPGGDPVVAKKIFNGNSRVSIDNLDGSVVVQSSDKIWTFNTNGDIIAPNGSTLGSNSAEFDFGAITNNTVNNKLEWFLFTMDVDNGTILQPAPLNYDAGTLI